MKHDDAMQLFLDRWFQQKLDDAGADFSAEPLTYDGNSQYDQLCYALVAEAERVCRLRFGKAPSGCQLQRALACAEFSRSRQKRLQAPAWKRWFRRLRRRRQSAGK